MIKFKAIVSTTAAIAASLAVGSASAANAIAVLDANALTFNNLAASALGAASYNNGTGTLTLPEASVTSALADFAAADGFKLSATNSGNTLSFTDFQFTNTGILSGKLKGSGSILYSFVSFTGDLLTAQTIDPAGLTATNFDVSPALTSYLTGLGLSSAQVSTIGTYFLSVTEPSLAVAVPEPTTYALMGLGLVGIAFVSKRRSQA